MLRTTIQIISLLWLTTCLACFQPKAVKKYTIGFSQCCQDPWRTVMNKEMLREMDFYPQAELIIKEAGSESVKQIAQIRELLNLNVDVIIIAPNESEPLTEIVEEIYEKGIPVILIDRETESEQYTAYIGADNYEIGKTACHFMASQMNEQGEIVELQMAMSISPAQDRSNGFRNALKNYPNM